MKKHIFTLLAALIITGLVGSAGRPAQAGPQQPTAAQYGDWQCWGEDGPAQCANFTAHDIQMLSPTDGWAVGTNGYVRHWDGSQWTEMRAPTGGLSLFTVDILAADDVWAAGDNGVVVRWNGQRWYRLPTPATDAGINGISMVSPTDGWAVGPDTHLWHWNGTEWTTVANPSGKWLGGVQMLSATDGWAGGYQGTLLHWDGAAWTQVNSPTNAFLGSFALLSANDGWVVGGNQALHWDGTAWTLAALPSNTAADIYMLSPTDGWIIGGWDSKALHWDGSSWSQVALPEGTRDIRNMTFGSPNLGWATSGSGGLMLRWDGSSWQTYQGISPLYLNAIDAAAPDNVWAGGNTLMHWNGVKWTRQDLPAGAADLQGISLASADNGWAVGGGGTILHWDGSSWNLASSPTTQDLTEVEMVSASDGWAVGPTALLRFTGGEWITQTIPVASGYPDLQGIAMLSATEGWIAGGFGVMRWDGAAWKEVDFNGYRLTGIDAAASNDVWASSTAGRVYHWDGSAWTEAADFSHPTDSRWLYGIDLFDGSAGWVVGSNIVARWDGKSWQQANPPPAGDVMSVLMTSETDGWAVGGFGTLWRYVTGAARLLSNYQDGAPGSSFTLSGENYPPNSEAKIFINHQQVGKVKTDVGGRFTFLLNTAGAEAGFYRIEATVNPTAATSIILDAAAELHPKEGYETTLDMPGGLATRLMFLPLVTR